VAGVEVGHVTLISGEGPLVVGKGPVRTGVTAILPRGRASDDPVFAGSFTLNGNGEMTGLAWLRESGFLEGQFLITNTYSVGVARDALIDWQARRGPGAPEVWGLPVAAGAPVGREIPEGTFREKENGSIILVVATDAPLLPQQLDRLARRAGMGLARTGSTAGDGSGDIFLAFSTANPGVQKARNAVAAQFLPNDVLNPVFDATVQATEEAIVNALVAGETMTGIDGHRVLGIPHDRLRDVLRKYGRLEARDP
jgi:L-aminopeptidase/D-esterase-like protein